MAESTTIKIVCFDLGGVILRICRSWAEGCAAGGLDLRGDVDALLAEHAGDDGWLELESAYQRGRIDVDAFTRGLSEIVGGLYTPDEILLVHRAWTLEEYEGVEDLVLRLHDAGLETAVLSNTCPEHWETLLRYPAVARLRNRHASHLIAARKPERAAYEAVERTTGMRGAEILFFDDLPENIEGARDSGWHAEQIDHRGETAEQMTRALDRHGVLGAAATTPRSS